MIGLLWEFSMIMYIIVPNIFYYTRALLSTGGNQQNLPKEGWVERTLLARRIEWTKGVRQGDKGHIVWMQSWISEREKWKINLEMWDITRWWMVSNIILRSSDFIQWVIKSDQIFWSSKMTGFKLYFRKINLAAICKDRLEVRMARYGKFL